MEHHHHSHSANSPEELVALMKYMVSHNEAHTKELSQLAESVKDINTSAYADVLAALECYQNGNDRLSSALSSMTEE